MEKDVALGSVGGIKITLVDGKAVIALTAGESALSGAIQLQAQMSGTVDAGVLVDMLQAEVDAKLPAGLAPIEAIVWTSLKTALLAIK